MVNADLLKYVIAREHFTTQDIADALNFSRQALNTRFTGEVDFKLTEIRTICKKLNLSPDEMHDIFFA